MIKFSLELPEEVVEKMEHFCAACEVECPEDLIVSPLRVFVPKEKLTEPIRCVRVEASS